MKIKVGVIGGSGLDNPDILKAPEDLCVKTKWGATSSPLRVGKIDDTDVVILSRHGRQHTIPPSQVNYRANIAALLDVGCTHILATTAVGSLRAEIERGDIVILDQFLDFTKMRCATFHEAFQPHEPVHTPMADPFNADLREMLLKTCVAAGVKVHGRGTVVTIEGPRFSTRAESNMYRLLGADVINMSIATEVCLANEAKIPYAAIAMSTDYDCWKVDEPPVSWEEILGVFQKNSTKVTSVLKNVIPVIRSAQSI